VTIEIVELVGSVCELAALLGFVLKLAVIVETRHPAPA
jgi:hypothetical protein